MPEFVVFLRAVNVGKRQLKMAEARTALEDSGFLDVESHIQTGNFLIRTPLRSAARVEAAVSACLGTHAGFDIVAMARTPQQLAALVEEVHGIPEVFGGSRRYVSFLKSAPTTSAKAELEAWSDGDERAFVLVRTSCSRSPVRSTRRRSGMPCWRRSLVWTEQPAT